MVRKLIVLLIGIFGINLAHGDEASTNESPHAWLRPDVMQAAYDINLTDEQRARFASELRVFVEGYRQGVDKVLNRGDVSDPAGRIERKRNSLAKDMDKSMADILNDALMPAYRKYRNLLLAELGQDVDAYYQKPNVEEIRVGNVGAH